MARTLKYQPLADRLAQSGEASVEMTFDEISQLTGGLPESATKFTQWWSNNRHHVQAKAWMDAGFKVSSIDHGQKRVRFTRQ